MGKMTLNFDFKHIFKCICTLIRSPVGIVLNNGHVINSMMLTCYLMWLPAYEEAAVTKLLYPDDPQDDPHAVELMLAIIEFSNSQLHISNDSFSMDTMVKNTVFSLAKQQSLDPYAPFFLGDIGDDPLEILFGCTCMIGGHNLACSYAQAINRLATAQDIDGVFKCHPELDPERVLSEDGVEGVSPGELQGENDDEEVMLMFEEALIDSSSADAPPQSNQPCTLDSSSPPLLQGPGICPDNYLLYNGRWIHKQTVCHLIINKDFILKSLNRLERVHAGYTKVNKCIDMSVGRITNQNLFLIGDIFVTILRSGRTLSIAILFLTAASLSGISHSSINIGVMKASRTTAKITGQLLTIITTCLSADVSQMFLWHNGYVTACLVIQGSSESTECNVVITVPGSLVKPVNPEPTFIQLCDDINVDDFLQDALQAACDLLWAKVVVINVSLKSIAVMTPSDETKFPYRHSDGTPAVISMEASNLLGASKGEWISSNTPMEVILKEPVSNTLPCGFCGRSSRSECAITITVPAKATTTWDTKCMYQHQFQYTSAEIGSKNTPCHNLPLKLLHSTGDRGTSHLGFADVAPGKGTRKTAVIPVGAVWHYNMHEHIFWEHEEYMVPGQRDVGLLLPVSVWKEMRLMDLEQTASCIPKTHWQPSYTPSDEIGKENVPLLVSLVPKCWSTSTHRRPTTTVAIVLHV
ncbi:hypothetical protein BDR07DRAFT_1380312 [Suillus spraguei]|nr:hypothetical protein BDR07DRAFT_1380312 [Suillus spraguei]